MGGGDEATNVDIVKKIMMVLSRFYVGYRKKNDKWGKRDEDCSSECHQPSVSKFKIISVSKLMIRIVFQKVGVRCQSVAQ